jgi:DNA-binding NtrC family response regulator
MIPESVILVFGGVSDGGETVARILSNHYRIVEANTVDEAMRQADGGVDLVVGQLDSPNFDSLKLLRSWKSQHPDTPFVMIANGGDVNAVVQAMKLGAADCIVKPIEPGDVQNVVSRVLESSTTNSTNGVPGERKGTIDIPPGTSLEELERAAVEQALTQHHGNRTHAARTLGISVRTLQRKLKAWGMPLHSHFGGPSNSGNGGGSRPSGPGSNIMYAVHDPGSPAFGPQHVH